MGTSGNGTTTPVNNLHKRREQLTAWETSEANHAPASVKNPERVKFKPEVAFLAACNATDFDEISRFLNDKVDINTSNIDGLTALHQACIDNKLDLIKFLIKHGADIHARDSEGWTPLHATALGGHTEVAKYLLKEGAKVGIANNDGDLPIDVAESWDMKQLLKESMALIDENRARNAEALAMQKDARAWLKEGRYRCIRDPRSHATPLHVAAAKGYSIVLSTLLQCPGVDINDRDCDGWTPLHAAAHWGQEAACRVLASHGADMAAVTHANQTVLDIAEEDLHDLLKELQAKQKELMKQSGKQPIITSMKEDDGPKQYTSRRSSVTRVTQSERHDLTSKSSEIEKHPESLPKPLTEPAAAAAAAAAAASAPLSTTTSASADEVAASRPPVSPRLRAAPPTAPAAAAASIKQLTPPLEELPPSESSAPSTADEESSAGEDVKSSNPALARAAERRRQRAEAAAAASAAAAATAAAAAAATAAAAAAAAAAASESEQPGPEEAVNAKPKSPSPPPHQPPKPLDFSPGMTPSTSVKDSIPEISLPVTNTLLKRMESLQEGRNSNGGVQTRRGRNFNAVVGSGLSTNLGRAASVIGSESMSVGSNCTNNSNLRRKFSTGKTDADQTPKLQSPPAQPQPPPPPPPLQSEPEARDSLPVPSIVSEPENDDKFSTVPSALSQPAAPAAQPEADGLSDRRVSAIMEKEKGEESETERRRISRRNRATKRATQGVAQDVVEQAKKLVEERQAASAAASAAAATEASTNSIVGDFLGHVNDSGVRQPLRTVLEDASTAATAAPAVVASSTNADVATNEGAAGRASSGRYSRLNRRQATMGVPAPSGVSDSGRGSSQAISDSGSGSGGGGLSRSRPGSYHGSAIGAASGSAASSELDYKRLYEKEKAANERLSAENGRLRDENEQLKRQSIEQRQVDKRLSEYEAQNRSLEQVMRENEKLKAENRALARVVARLSRQ